VHSVEYIHDGDTDIGCLFWVMMQTH